MQPSPAPQALLVPGGWRIEGLPGPVRDAGPSAERRLLEFFTAEISNPNTRLAYSTAAGRFFRWCETRNLALREITPFAVATYIEEMQASHALPTVKQHLSALRALLDYLVVGQVLPSNPAAPVRGPKYVVKHGKTPVLSPGEARTLLDSIDLARPAGLRDRALLATMVYSFARVGAVIGNEKGTPLWRSMTKGGAFTPNRMNRVDVFRMIKRRVRQAELGVAANCHTFRATGITAYLLNGGTVENAQAIAAHESPRTTKLYDRTADEISLDEIERIVI